MRMTRAQAGEAYTAAKSMGNRALPTLDAIMKMARIKSALRPVVNETDDMQLMLANKSPHIEHPVTKQNIFKSPDEHGKEAFDIGQQVVEVDCSIRLTKADLPKLPEPSDDPDRNRRYVEARAGLANDIADLGEFFNLSEDKKGE